MIPDIIIYLKEIFLYSKDSPLLFSQLYFWLFFLVVLFFYSFLKHKRISRSAYLFFISLFFYYKSGGFFFFLLIFSTFSDYFLGKAIYFYKKKALKTLFLVISIVVNLGILAYFKYTYFLVDIFNEFSNSDLQAVDYLSQLSNSFFGTSFEISKIILPVGISFYTFQTISYTVDVYRDRVKAVDNILDFGFYVSFFPQLVAGPIVRAAEFIPQVYEKYNITKADFNKAVYLILNGLFKKIIISDFISTNFVDRVFQDPASYSGFENLMGLYGYALQIYCDFSGYSDIAIGVALLLGFRLLLNFNSPYKAANITDFWRRWHISLSSWLKDYLYIPLGGNKKASFGTYFFTALILNSLVVVAILKSYLGLAFLGLGANSILFVLLLSRKYKIHTYLNLLITMLLGGLWHGANLRFVLWGLLHGFALSVHKLYLIFFKSWQKTNFFIRLLSIFITFHFVCFTWIFFRAENIEKAKIMISRIFNNFNFAGLIERVSNKDYIVIFGIILLGFVIHWISTPLKQKTVALFGRLPMFVKIIIVLIVIFIIYQGKVSEVRPFIYFQF